jgi:hypothetical protein
VGFCCSRPEGTMALAGDLTGAVTGKSPANTAVIRVYLCSSVDNYYVVFLLLYHHPADAFADLALGPLERVVYGLHAPMQFLRDLLVGLPLQVAA